MSILLQDLTVLNTVFILVFMKTVKTREFIFRISGEKNKETAQTDLQDFVKRQFALLIKKNLRIPVSTYQL